MSDGYDHDIQLLTVLHRPASQQMLEGRGSSREQRTLHAAAGPALQAAALELRGAAIAATVLPVKPPPVRIKPPDSDPSGETYLVEEVCMHAWASYIETIDRGRVTRRFRTACSAEPLFERAFQLPTLALAQFPHCGGLEPEHYRNGSERLTALGQGHGRGVAHHPLGAQTGSLEALPVGASPQAPV